VSESAAAAAPANVGQTPSDEHAEAVRRVLGFSFAQVLLLVAQSGLGMGVNLFVTLPAADQGKGLLSAFGDAMSRGPAAVAAHAGFGLLVFINACLLIVFSLTVRDTSVKLASAVGWLCIAGAAVSGAAFVNADPSQNSANYASLVMALLTMVALGCYAWNLYTLGAHTDGGERNQP